MVALMDEAKLDDALDIARRLRAGGINTEVQMEPKKVGKQFQYAARAGIRFVVLAGDDELARGVVAFKPLRGAETTQSEHPVAEVGARVAEFLRRST